MDTVCVFARSVPKHRCYLIYQEVIRLHIENPQFHIVLYQPTHVSDQFLYNNRVPWLTRKITVPTEIPLCTLVVRINGEFPNVHESQEILDLMIFDLNQSITWAVTSEVEPYVSEILDLCKNPSSRKIVYTSENELLEVTTDVLVMVQTPLQHVWDALSDRVDIWTLNIEMMTRTAFPSFVSFRKVALERNLKILDYSHSNISVGSSFIPRTSNALLRLPYSAAPLENSGDGVGFIGTMSPRRLHIVTALMARGVKTLLCPNAFKTHELKAFRSKCRIILNVHFDADHTIFEVFRCIPAILDGCMVVSETSAFSDKTMYRDLVSRIVFCDYAQIVQTVLVKMSQITN